MTLNPFAWFLRRRCRRHGAHRMVAVYPQVSAETTSGLFRVTGKCSRCGLLEGHPDELANGFRDLLESMPWAGPRRDAFPDHPLGADKA